MVANAIESVRFQTFDKWELIIIDDGSTDDTRHITRQFEDVRIRYIFQRNKGKSAARNRGILESKGEFICFLDSDDYFLEDHLSRLAEEIQEREHQIGVYRTGMYSEGLQPIHRTPIFDPTEGIHPVLFFAKNMVGTNTLCIHKDILVQHRFDERFHFFQDTHLLLRILAEHPLFQIPFYTCVYTIHPGRSSYGLYSTDDPWKLIQNNVDAIMDLFDNYPVLFADLLDDQLKEEMVSRKYMDHAAESLLAGQIALSWRCFLKALSYDQSMRFGKRYLRYLPKVPLKMLFGYPRSR